MKLKPILAAWGLALLLVACSDSSYEAEAPTPQPQGNTGDVPASALGSATAFSQFVASLMRTEIGKPLEINGAVPPTSETADPIPVR